VVFTLLSRLIRPGMITEIVRSAKRTALLSGSASFVAYTLVIWAFMHAPIALVTALRETSIVFALLIGVVVLRERLDLAKVASAMITLFGSALLRLAR
jgi:drug/metabolite transporter (DMT)-like permease